MQMTEGVPYKEAEVLKIRNPDGQGARIKNMINSGYHIGLAF